MKRQAVVIVETVINDHVYRLELPWGAPFAECMDAAALLHKEVVAMSNEAEERAASEKAKNAQEAADAQNPILAELTD